MSSDGIPVFTMPDLANPVPASDKEVVEKIVYVDRPVEVTKTVTVEVIKYLDRIKTIRKYLVPDWAKMVMVLEAIAILVLYIKLIRR